MPATASVNEATDVARIHRPVGGMAPSYRSTCPPAVTQRVGAGHARDTDVELSHGHRPDPPPRRGHGPLLQVHLPPRRSHNV